MRHPKVGCGPVGEWFSGRARFLGYNGTIIHYLREVSVGGEGSGWARFANELDKAIEDDGRANMVALKSDHGKYRVERSS